MGCRQKKGWIDYQREPNVLRYHYLLPKMDGRGRVMAMEILVPNAAIRNLIREDKIHQIYSAMQTGQEKYGMQTFNQSLAHLS
jgi:twitching motility protein PilT